MHLDGFWTGLWLRLKLREVLYLSTWKLPSLSGVCFVLYPCLDDIYFYLSRFEPGITLKRGALQTDPSCVTLGDGPRPAKKRTAYYANVFSTRSIP